MKIQKLKDTREPWDYMPRGRFIYKMVGHGMYPTFMNGDYLTVEPCRNVKPGTYVIAMDLKQTRRAGRPIITVGAARIDSEGSLYLQRENFQYRSRCRRIDDKFVIVGRVVKMSRLLAEGAYNECPAFPDSGPAVYQPFEEQDTLVKVAN